MPDSSMICGEPIAAGSEDDLAAAARGSQLAAAPPTHAGGTAAIEHDGFDQATGLKPQIAAMERRLEEGARRRPAPAALLVDVKGAAALVVAGVEVRHRFDAGLLGGRAERVEQVPAHARRLDPQLAAHGMQRRFRP